jgi:hypothetical protein
LKGPVELDLTIADTARYLDEEMLRQAAAA